MKIKHKLAIAAPTRADAPDWNAEHDVSLKTRALTINADSIVEDDLGAALVASGETALALPAPGAGSPPGFAAGWFCFVFGPATVTSASVTINGKTSLRVSDGEGAVIVSTGSSYKSTSTPNGVMALFASLAPVADRMAYFTGPNGIDLTPLTAFARLLNAATDASGALDLLGVSTFIKSLVVATNAAAARSTLGAVNIAGDTMTGALTLNADPSNALHSATKQYVDNIVAGFKPKQPVRLASTANLSLSGLSAIDGVTPVAGNRILAKNQTTASQNGIYVAASGAWSRATDFDSWTEIPGATFVVQEGTANADTGWLCTVDDGGTLGTSAIAVSQWFGSGLYQTASAVLNALAATSPAADKLAYFTSGSAAALTTLSSFIRTLLDDADAATARATLGAAPLDSPAFTNNPSAPTKTTGDNTTALATCQFVNNSLSNAAVGALINITATGTTMLDSTYNGKTVVANATLGNITLSTDTLANLPTNFEVHLVRDRADASLNTITFDPDSTVTVDGRLSARLITAGDSATVRRNGSAFVTRAARWARRTVSFTASGTFTTLNEVPLGCLKFLIKAFGGGASGSSQSGGTSDGRGAGGGAGATLDKVANPNDTTLAITIGVGGTSATSGVGVAGGNTTVVGTNLGTLTAGGGSNSGTNGPGAGGNGGTATGGDRNYTGGGGGAAPGVTNVFGIGGDAVNGGRGGHTNVGTPGSIPGGGGAGENHAGGGSGAGARGQVDIEI